LRYIATVYVPTAVLLTTCVWRSVTPCRSASGPRRFEGSECLRLYGQAV